MKKLITAILFLILSSPMCFSTSDFHFSIVPRLSFSYGELSELLYYSDGTLVSQLDWEQKCLFNLGLSAIFSFHNFSVSALFDYSLPSGTSYMTDSDFYNSGERYSWTEHPVEQTRNLTTELQISYKLMLSKKIFLIPELQFNYLYSSFEAGIGNGTRYGNPIRVYGIDYYRHSFFLFTGFSLQVKPKPFIILNTSLFIAPWNYQRDFDYHQGIEHPFSTYKYQTGHFTKFKTIFSIDYKINYIFSIELFTTILCGYSDKGITFSDYYTNEIVLNSSQQSGASIYSIKIGTSIKVLF